MAPPTHINHAALHVGFMIFLLGFPLPNVEEYLALPQKHNFPARVQSVRAQRACALRALGLLLADGAPTVGRGKTF